jgi:hypothetical protein
MTTTRISHTGHNHPNTTAARTACRKAMKATKVGSLELAIVGNGKAVHYIDKAVGTTRCGKTPNAIPAGFGEITDVTCKGCRSKYGQAHG